MQPKTFLIGYTTPDYDGLASYLKYTEQVEFFEQLHSAIAAGIPPGMALCSFYAKLCYKSLVLGKNANVSKVRDIEDNIAGCFSSGHGSVFEHCWLNFITTNCSRVFTHELVRHRVGTAFSQTSGRYVSLDSIDLVIPPELDDSTGAQIECPKKCLGIDIECSLCAGHGTVAPSLAIAYAKARLTEVIVNLRSALIKPGMDFGKKKKITSAIRRLAPNGQTNEIGWSCNIRSLRHMIEMRTNRHAEWEIRVVFDEVAKIVNERWPLMLTGGKSEVVDGITEWTGLKV